MGQENMKWKFKFANKNFPQQYEIANNRKEYFHFIFLWSTEATQQQQQQHQHHPCQMESTFVLCTHRKRKIPFSSCNAVITLHANVLSYIFYFLIRTLNPLKKKSEEEEEKKKT